MLVGPKQTSVVTKIILLSVLIYLLTLTPTRIFAEVNATQIGVHEGDIFQFTIDKFEKSENVMISRFYIGAHEDINFILDINEGDEFTVKFDSVSLDVYSVDGPDMFIIQSVVLYQSYILGRIDYLNFLGGFVTSIDWNGHSAMLEQDKLDEKTLKRYESYDLSIINTSQEFGYSLETTNSSMSDEGELIEEISSQEYRYDRETGMLVYSRRYFEEFTDDNPHELDFIIRRIPSLAPQRDIPGFEILIILSGMIISVIIVKRSLNLKRMI